MPLSTLKVPLSIELFFVIGVFTRNTFFKIFGSESAQNCSKMPPHLILFNFRQLLLYDLPPKNYEIYQGGGANIAPPYYFQK